MKLLLHSNSARTLTGYGVQTALLARRLKAAGHDVAISAYYGQQSGMGEWEGIPVYPVGLDPYGNDILAQHANHFFGDDEGWIIPIMDVFGLMPGGRANPSLQGFNIAAWCPVDHFPVPPDVRKFFGAEGYPNAVPIAMSKFGETSLREAGLDPLYAPLAVDTDVYRPTPVVDYAGQKVEARQLLGLPDDAFVVMMNGMNKGWAIHRKGFPHAFLAFAQFAVEHPEAVLYMHSEPTGAAGGINLYDLAINSGVPVHQIRFVDQYAYSVGIAPEILAASYTAADVLLAPSMGEGFCVPLIEAQACGTPVIVTDFSAQPELVGGGWKVHGQPWWEAAQSSWMISPNISEIVTALESAYDADRELMADLCISKAREYDADLIFETCWKPILADLDGGGAVELDRPPMPDREAVAVLVPVLTRPENVAPLVESFNETNDGSATLYFVCDPNDTVEIDAVHATGAKFLISDHGSTFAQKVNSGFEQTLQPWVFICGDDVRFRDGWIQAARKVSARFDVIGTNDSPDGKGNPRVASGSHADHLFIRRSYVDTYGGSLDGKVLHEGYRHFFCDVELVELAKARKVWTPCLDSLVEHMHPDLGKSEVDDVYRQGWGEKEHDAKVWKKRAPLVVMQRQGRGQ